MSETLYLIDGHGIAYRAYFALSAGGGAQRWSTSFGEPTAGIYGFASILLRLLEKEKPKHLAIAFDTGKTFRNEMYPLYKATRAKMPEDLRPQITRMRELVDAFGIPRLEMEGFEADDVLGSIANHAVTQGYKVKILTGDRDLLQLVTDQISVNLAGSKLADALDYTPQNVETLLGVLPSLVVDYKALVGDSSDNYPGVAGIGPKTALKLLDEFRSLDGIYQHIAEIGTSTRQKLESNRDNAYLSQNLARIRTDLAQCITFSEAATVHLNFEAAESFFKCLEFNTLIPKLRKIAPLYQVDTGQLSFFSQPAQKISSEPSNEKCADPVAIETIIVDTEEKLAQLVVAVQDTQYIALDTETTSIEPLAARLVGISIAVNPFQGYYIPIGHETLETSLPLDLVLRILGPLLDAQQPKKIGHNIKFDILTLENHGFSVHGVCFDTMIAAYAIDPASKNLGLKNLSAAVLHSPMTQIEELIGKGKNQISMAQVPIASAAPYAVADAEATLRLMPILKKELEKCNANKIFYELEMPLIPILVQMERAGISLDVLFLKNMSQMLEKRLSEIEQQIYALVGFSFNLNSTQQLSKVLFESIGLIPPFSIKKTASGHYSTAANVLDEMQGQHPILDLILENRELSKLKSTYVDALPTFIIPRTHKIHTSFNQTGTLTGRLASSNPNLQNIPTRTELGQQVRTAFVASAGRTLLSVDYSQIELRIIAHLAQDRAMIDAFQQGKDIHTETAAAIYSVEAQDVTKDMRRHAKAINFGLIYGMSAFGLSKTANLNRSDADQFVKAYFMQFPKIQLFLDELKKQAAEDGYVETIYGRRRYFPDLGVQTNRTLRMRAEREAINAPVQGTAADIMKAAMIAVADCLTTKHPSAEILLQVHDELLIECDQNDVNNVRRCVQSAMENCCTISVPLLTEARSGLNWGILTPME